MGVFWIALGIYAALTVVMDGTFKSGHFWVNALQVIPPACYTLVGIGWILVGFLFKVALSKKLD